MEYINSIWQVGIIALVAGAMIGALAYRIFSPSVKQSDELKSDLDKAKRELDSYKTSVNSHFSKTSELVNDLTQNYVKVYQHLAEGAQTLGDSRQLNNLLEQQQGKVLLTVDDEADAGEPAADARQAESSPLPEAPPQTVTDSSRQGGESSPAEEQPEDRKEDFTGTGAPVTAADSGESEEPGKDSSEEPGKDSPKARESMTAPDTDDEAESGEPVLDVSKIKQASAADEDESATGAGAVIPDPEESHEVKPTRH